MVNNYTLHLLMVMVFIKSIAIRCQGVGPSEAEKVILRTGYKVILHGALN